jgi:hypothetical protein
MCPKPRGRVRVIKVQLGNFQIGYRKDGGTEKQAKKNAVAV